jgi:hypothetical protein
LVPFLLLVYWCEVRLTAQLLGGEGTSGHER